MCSRAVRSRAVCRAAAGPLAVFAVVLLTAGCGEPGGGINAGSSVSVRVEELDDDEVPQVSRQTAAEMGIEVPVIGPEGRVVVPPELRDRIPEEPPPGDGSGGDSSDGDSSGGEETSEGALSGEMADEDDSGNA